MKIYDSNKLPEHLKKYFIPAPEIGLESTPEEYIEKMVNVFREVKRILHPSGCVFCNLGDSYWSDTLSRKDPVESMWGNRPASDLSKGRDNIPKGNVRGGLGKRPPGLKPKDLCMIPARVALALQSDGWWLRSCIPWVKRNSMPESVTDRPASALEYIFLLAKNSKYFFDMDAVRVAHKRDFSNEGGGWENGKYKPGDNTAWKNDPSCKRGADQTFYYNPSGRNYRNTDLFFESIKPPHGLISTEDELVGLDVNPQAMKAAHFATFPEKLVEPCIKAGTSEKGCCPECLSPWEQIVEKTTGTSIECPKTQAAHEARGGIGKPIGTVGKSGGGRVNGTSKTTGWKPGCKCEESKPIPCTVLDPFFGSGTVAKVAEKLRRNWVGIELSKDYAEIAKNRITQAIKQRRLF